MGSCADIEKKIEQISHQPGVYIFRDHKGDVLYIGKAADLKDRVRSYLRQPLLLKISIMMQKVKGVHILTTSDEKEALLLENALIKQYKPPYNMKLRDDKDYPLICISEEKFPRVAIGRRKRFLKLKAECFGPYPDATALRKALSTVRRIIPYRTCINLPKRHCIYYPLKLCPAPCEGRILRQDYASLIKQLKLFLQGKRQKVIRNIHTRMQKLSDEQKYEQAKIVRDKIYLLEKTVQRLKQSYDVSVPSILGELFETKKDINIIEGIDVSNISGVHPVGSVVRFVRCRPFKSEYRRYRILSSERSDAGMLSEVVHRRYGKLLEEKKQMPDLILVDGGIAQANAAKRILNGLRILSVCVAGLAKKQEWLFVPGKKEPIVLSRDSASLQALQMVRDEAHRFAMSYHKKIRSRSAIHSILDDISGIGPVRKSRIISEFGSVEGIICAGYEKVAKTAGCSIETAKKWIERMVKFSPQFAVHSR
ncbi:hypothetical protein B9J78_00535 [bacterium Unc6]|nr:hypothetical protein [bacterium Unc6]